MTLLLRYKTSDLYGQVLLLVLTLLSFLLLNDNAWITRFTTLFILLQISSMLAHGLARKYPWASVYRKYHFVISVIVILLLIAVATIPVMGYNFQGLLMLPVILVLVAVLSLGY